MGYGGNPYGILNNYKKNISIIMLYNKYFNYYKKYFYYNFI